MKQFKVGDVVRLNSGSPKMTVTDVDNSGVFCTWYEDGKMNTKVLPEGAITLDNDDQSFPGADGDDPTD